MILFAFFGILVNGYAAWKLSNGKTMNEKVISWHLIEDVLGWVAVLIVAIILKFKDIQYLDPLLSIFITLYILWNVGSRLKESVFLFLQGTPQDINQEEIEIKLLAIDKVASIHHLHIWSLDGEKHVFSVHICLEKITTNNNIIETKQAIKLALKDYHFKHITIETELKGEICFITSDLTVGKS
jgi:cobalt-zinc-cadmium efflux system protein